MKVIRAERNIFVPQNPENPDKSMMRLVATGLVALVPKDYELPDGSYQEIGVIKKSSKKKSEEDEE